MQHLGIHTDEALFIGGIQQVHAAYYSVTIFQRTIPLMLDSYIGTLKSLIYAFVFRIFTRSPSTVRFPVLLMGVVTIWLFFLLLRRISGLPAAVAGCLLLATDAIFLLTTEFDWGPVALAHLLLMAGMLLLYRYYETRGTSLLAWGFFLFGLAMWDKAIFIWSLGALFVAALATFPRTLLRLLTPRAVAVAALAFLAGAAPLLVFNLDRRGQTFRTNVARATEDLSGKVAVLQATFSGDGLMGYLVREDHQDPAPLEPRTRLARASERVSSVFGRPRHTLLLPALLGALLLLPLLWRSRTRGPRTILFALVFCLTAWLQMLLNRGTGGSVHHIVVLWPFPQLVVAVAFGEVAQKFGRAGRTAFGVMLVLAISANLLVVNEYYRLMRRNGGGPTWSDAIYPLAVFLRGVPARQVMPIDWGLVDNLRLLEGERVPVRVGGDPLDKPVLDAHDREVVRQWLITPQTVFVSHTDRFEIIPGVNRRLDEIARANGMARESMGIFRDGNGREVFEVFRYNPTASQTTTSPSGPSS